MPLYSAFYGRRWSSHPQSLNLETQTPLCFVCSRKPNFLSPLFISFVGVLKAPISPFCSQEQVTKHAQVYTFGVVPRLQIFQKKRAQLVLSLLAPTYDSLYYFPLIQASGSLTASATSLGRKLRSSPLAQLLTCHFMRRYLISLAKLNFELWVKGGVGLFSAA